MVERLLDEINTWSVTKWIMGIVSVLMASSLTYCTNDILVMSRENQREIFRMRELVVTNQQRIDEANRREIPPAWFFERVKNLETLAAQMREEIREMRYELREIEQDHTRLSAPKIPPIPHGPEYDYKPIQ